MKQQWQQRDVDRNWKALDQLQRAQFASASYLDWLQERVLPDELHAVKQEPVE